GFRTRFSRTLLFDPTNEASAAYNPLMEVRRGINEVRDVQNIADVLVDPGNPGRGQRCRTYRCRKAVRLLRRSARAAHGNGQASGGRSHSRGSGTRAG
ncbi:MAG: hypothetical protein VX195_00065, partial [Pseudomonadota bacterium]|nr:hypothetical protein [Pseudomonadota bacterium]